MTGEEILQRRRAAGLSRTDFAKLAGVSKETIRRVEEIPCALRLSTERKLTAALALAESDMRPDGDAAELLSIYRQCSRDQKQWLMATARFAVGFVLAHESRAAALA